MRRVCMSAAALCVAAGVASAVDLRLVNEQNLDVVCDSVNNPGFFIGNNPSVISLVGDNLFVAGYNNSGAAAPVVGVVKIENIFGSRAFRTIPTSAVTLAPFRGFYGLQYDYGTARTGLVANYDNSGPGTAGAFRLFDVDTQLNPILLEESPAGTSPRGGAGPAFDYGHDGLGFDLNGDSTPDGPVLGILEFTSYGGVQARGPFGVRARDVDGATNNGLDIINGRIYDGNSINGGGNPTAPIINVADPSGCTISGTLWRDLSIDPRNGTLAARATNDLVIATRDTNNGAATIKNVDLNGGCDNTATNFAFQILQRVEILHGLSGGDKIVLNDYSAAATDVNGWVRFFNLDGTPATDVNLQNADGSPFSAPNTSGVYDFSWDAINGRLAVLSFASRRVYIFEAFTGPVCNRSATCPADVDDGSSSGTPDGGVGIEDLLYYLSVYDAGTSCADVDDGSGTGTLDQGVGIEDLLYYLSRYDAGC